jgi:hypothetical protein
MWNRSLNNIPSTGEFPRDRQHIYNVNRRKKEGFAQAKGIISSDPILEVIGKAKEDEKARKDQFIREIPIHQELIVFLAFQQQLCLIDI